jgi:hypothetical protein
MIDYFTCEGESSKYNIIGELLQWYVGGNPPPPKKIAKFWGGGEHIHQKWGATVFRTFVMIFFET